MSTHSGGQARTFPQSTVSALAKDKGKKASVRSIAAPRIYALILAGGISLFAGGCQQNKVAQAAGPAMQAMPVKTVAVTLAPVAQSSEYVATIKSRHSATLQPQVSGRLMQILARSGDHVRVGQPLMTIDAQPQLATVQAQRATEQQKKALFDYNTIQVNRQRKLFAAGVTSRDALDQAEQAFDNSKADYESAVALRKTQEEQLSYYTIRSPYNGIVGDIPVHVGDYVSSSTILTTVDESGDLEAYIYVPTDRASQVKLGLAAEISDTNGKLLEKTRIDFLSPQVDPTMQGILVKAPVHSAVEIMRNAQMVKARVIWNTTPMAVVPVLAVTRLGGQTFAFVVRQANGHAIAAEVPVTLGETVGNTYAVLAGLKEGDQVIVSGTQFLVNGMPVIPLGA